MTASDPIVGYVPGAWDLFHIGHLNLLLRARQFCDRLLVGVVTDQELVVAKGKLPVVPLEERLDVVRQLTLVDEVVIDYSSDKLDAWRRYGFDVLFKGDDWKDTPKGARMERDLGAVGAVVHYLPYTMHTSSTKLRALIGSRG